MLVLMWKREGAYYFKFLIEEDKKFILTQIFVVNSFLVTDFHFNFYVLLKKVLSCLAIAHCQKSPLCH
jgi:hypothetical protein